MFLLKKKATQEYPRPMTVFFQFSFESNTATSDKHKGRGGGGVQ